MSWCHVSQYALLINWRNLKKVNVYKNRYCPKLYAILSLYSSELSIQAIKSKIICHKNFVHQNSFRKLYLFCSTCKCSTLGFSGTCCLTGNRYAACIVVPFKLIANLAVDAATARYGSSEKFCLEILGSFSDTQHETFDKRTFSDTSSTSKENREWIQIGKIISFI